MSEDRTKLELAYRGARAATLNGLGTATMLQALMETMAAHGLLDGEHFRELFERALTHAANIPGNLITEGDRNEVFAQILSVARRFNVVPPT